MNLPFSTNKAPPSGELDATSGSGLRGFSRPLGEGGCERSEQTEGVTSGQANFALEPETLPPCQRLPPRGSWQNRQVLTEGVRRPLGGAGKAAGFA